MRYVVAVLLAVLFAAGPVSASSVRPVQTAIQSGFYIDGVNTPYMMQTYGTTASYTLLLPMDHYVWQVQNLSVVLRSYNGRTWYSSPYDSYIQPVVTEVSGVVSLITSSITIDLSDDDKIHEYTLCYEFVYSQNDIQLVCHAFRVYSDDGTVYDAGWGVDYPDGTSDYITLHYLDQYFFTDESVLLYCTLYTLDASYCDGLVPVPGLGLFPSGVTPPDPPLSDTDYNGVYTVGSGVDPVDQKGWMSKVWENIKSTADRAFASAWGWLLQNVIPNFGIDVTPLRIVADYLYFYGVMLSTVRAILPLDLLKLLVDMALYGTSIIWTFMLYSFVRKMT